MSDTPSNKKPIIPQFREKSMYIKYINPRGEEIENSYSVQSSFKGILRISPNNGNTLTEKTTVQLPSKELSGKENIAFRDSISHLIELPYTDDDTKEDEKALINPDDIKEDNDDRQFLMVSESEGYQLDLRIASSSIETNNLYVRGEVAAEQLIINANQVLAARNQTFKHLTINGVGLPVYPDIDNFTTTYNKELIEDPIVAPGITALSESDKNYDEDKSAILVTNGDNKLVYKNSTDLINELILEALMSMESVPTGSIHYFPITIEQYCKLKGTHNSKKYDNDTSDPLIRDYLLCDGSLYYAKDFPELAKILNGATIFYDKQYTDDEGIYHVRINSKGADTNNNGETTNTESEQEPEKGTFRVPDLRGQYIRSAYLSHNRADEILKGTVGSHRYSQLPLSPPDRVSNSVTAGNKHIHHTFYGTYEAQQCNVAKDDNNEFVALLSGYSTIGNSTYTFPGVLAAYARCYDGRENHMPTHYYMTSPQIYDTINFNMNGCSIDTGVTSLDITYVGDLGAGVNSSLKDVKDIKPNYKFMSKGEENNPTFIGVLPFIRI